MQTVLECKSCGGQLKPVDGQRIVYCAYCGSANVFTFVDRISLYNQANFLRQRNEFDRAVNVYENIINEDPGDAEAYFGIALCKYGIEYVDDPADGGKIPTCHRTRIKLFSQDDDYLKAVSLSDPDVANIYRTEAERIDHILKGIQKLSSAQKKYDVFICYKESDKNGNRTKISVIAQDIYEQLENRGYRVFFARKTLAGMIGSDYEPVIFSALYSAKVMLVIGTRSEEFQGIWVKNEWIRFLERIAEGDECTLIPCYRDMSPYDLPSEMVNIQSLDISKIGFMQDITDAMERLVKRNGSVVTAEMPAGNAAGLKKRAYIFLEQGDFAQATKYFERALDLEPEDCECYWGKLLVTMGCRTEQQLCDLLTPISGYNDYQMALRFADDEHAAEYRRYSNLIDEMIAEENRKKEEQARQAAKEAEKQQALQREAMEKERRLRAEKRKQAAKRNRKIAGWLISIAIVIMIIAVVCIMIVHPIVTRAGSLFLSQFKDDPVAAYNFYTKMTKKQDYMMDIIKEISYWLDGYGSPEYSTAGEKIHEIDDYCIGYPKAQAYMEQHMADGTTDNDESVELELYGYILRAQCVLYLDGDGNLNCALKELPTSSDTGYSVGISDLVFYKSLQSLVNACGKHRDIEKFYVMSNYMNEYGVIFFIDDKGSVYAEPYGYSCEYDYDEEEHIVTQVDDYIGIDEVEKWRNVTDLKMIDTGHLCIPNLCGLNRDGEILSTLFHVRGDEDSEWNGYAIDIDDYDWVDIQSRNDEESGLLHPDTACYSSFDIEKFNDFCKLEYSAEWICISGYTGEVLDKE